MTKQNTKKEPQKRAPKRGVQPPKDKQSGLSVGLALKGDKDEPLGREESVRMAAGVALLLLAAFTLLAFTSHLFTGGEDQKVLQGGYMGHARNWVGYLGAMWSNYWITDNFGLGAFMIPVFLFAASLRLTKAYYVRLWKWFVNCAFLLVWTSVAAAFFLATTFAATPAVSYISPGGIHGSHVVAFLAERIGTVGTFVVIVAAFVAYLCYVSAETIRILRQLMHPGQLARQLNSRYPVLAWVARMLTAIARKTKGGDTDNRRADNATTATTATNAADEAAHDETSAPTVMHLSTELGETEATATDDPADTNTATTTTTAATEADIDPDIPMAEVLTETTDTDWISVAGADTADAGTDASTAPAPGFTVTQTHEEPPADEDKPIEPYDPKLDLEQYHYPTLDLLKHYEVSNSANLDREELTKNKDQIVSVLKSFGVEISTIKATIGPTITLYEITPAPGVRITKIRNLEDDIALSLAALGIRIIAPIPGKGTIGIEVPNAKPQIVSMESIINSRKFQESTMELPMALGKTITNEVFMADLAKMPHLLVAGATGQGKSVGLNAIITSLLYKKHPAELKFVMVDPKKVEFSIYSPIVNHFLAQIEDDPDEPIITDVQKVVNTLKSLCVEMDTRYDLLKRARAKNIKEYNEKFRNRQLNPEHGHHFMPYIVVVIDEFGDLIMTAGKEIELPIARIAQLARAVGMHMIIATQRPTTNIITGTIKANFPARMAFRVSAMIDSRTILDRPGANQLIGKGDMLFLAGSEPIRLQCAFVDTPEVEAIANYIARQQSYTAPFPLPLPPTEDAGMSSGAAEVDVNHLDPLFEEAAKLIVLKQQGSTSLIQRKFSIGFNRAGRLMDQMERMGVVGPTQGSKPRDVLIQDEMSLQMLLNNIG